MPTVKSYSVAKTQKSYDPATAVAASTVYSTSQTHSGRNGAYDHATAQGLVEGRTPTLVKQDQAVEDSAATSVAITTNADGPIEVRNTRVVATTRTITGTGAGLIVSFTSTNADPTQIAAMTVEDAGEGYSANDTVEIDGYPGSVCTVSVA